MSLIKSTYKILKKKKVNESDYVVFLFFIIFLILNRNGPVRIYTGFITFFIIYILKDLNLSFINKNSFYFLFRYVLIFFVVFKILNIDFIKIKNLKENYLYFANNMKNCDFPLKKKTSEFDKHMEYYVYLVECEKKPNINMFYSFYKY